MAIFGGKRIQELEAQLQQLQAKLDQETAEKNDLAQRLEAASGRVAALEAELNDFDLEALKKETSATKAEYEGLRDLYTRKNREFDDFKEEEEQRFARDQAIQRHNLENEIRDNRQANQDYVTSTVRTFGESYNYYLNQIKVLMDALGSVATRTGEALFSGENGDLKARFGHQMRDVLKLSAESVQGGDGDEVIIGVEEAAPARGEDVEAAEEAIEETDGFEAEIEGPDAAEEEAEDAGEAELD